MFFETKKSTELIFITNVNIFKLKRTRFDIRTKWKLIEQPISIYKIKNTEIRESKQSEPTHLRSKFRLKRSVSVNEKHTINEHEYDLIVIIHIFSID